MDEVLVVGVDGDLVFGSNKVEMLFLKGLYYCYKLLVVYRIVEFYTLELLQEEGDRVQLSFFISLS